MTKEFSKKYLACGDEKMELKDIVKVIAETYRDDAERNEYVTCGEVFDFYGYDTEDLKEEIYYSLAHDFEGIENKGFEFFDDCSIVLHGGTDISYRKLVSAIRRYKF